MLNSPKLKALLLAAAVGACFPAAASDYFVVIPVKGRVASASQAAITVTLNSVALPAADQGAAYSFDFKQALSVTGDAAYNPASVSWTLQGTLPAGLSLSAAGVLSGTPTTAGTQGFAVKAVYKTQSAQTNYNLAVVLPTQLTLAGSADFGSVALDAATQRTITVSNLGAQTLSQVYLSQQPTVAGLSVTASTCGTQASPINLAAGQSCTVSLSWTPTDAGSLAGTFTFVSSKNTVNSTLAGVAEPASAAVSALLRYDSTPFTDDKGNAVTSVGTAPTLVAGNAAVGAGSANLAGTGGHTLPLAPSDFASSDFTVESYVKPTSFSGTLFSRDTNNNVNYGNAALWLNANGTVSAYCNPNSGNSTGRITVNSTNALTLNAWNHVAWTRSGSNWNLFINGKKQPTATGACAFRSTDVTRVGHGLNSSAASSFLPGQLDHFRITKGRSIYNADFTPAAQ